MINNKKSIGNREKLDSAINYENRAVNYSYNCIAITVILLFLVWILNTLKIFIIEQYLIDIAFGGTVLIWGLSFIVKKVIGYESALGRYVISFLLIFVITFINALLTYHGTLLLVLPILCSLLANDKKQEIFTYVMSVLGVIVATSVGFHYGLCDANMIIFTTGPMPKYVTMLSSGVTEINTDSSKVLLYFAFPKIVALTDFAIMCLFIRKEIANRARKELEIRRLAETDALTGIYNRNKFNEDIKTLESDNVNVAVVYSDINNLKTVNDSMGHEAGDSLIIGWASIINKIQNDRINAYRLGGDEFVILIRDTESSEVDDFVEETRKKIEETSLEDNLKLSVAIGYAVGNSKDIKGILTEADEKMYSNKFEMKKNQ